MNIEDPFCDKHFKIGHINIDELPSFDNTEVVHKILDEIFRVPMKLGKFPLLKD